MHPVERHKFLAIARGADAAADTVAIAEAELALGLLGDEDVLRQGSEIITRPAQEAAALRGKLQDAVGEQLGAPRGIGLEEFEDEVVPGAVGIEAEAQCLGARRRGRREIPE